MIQEQHFTLPENHKAALLSLAQTYESSNRPYEESNEVSKELQAQIKTLLPEEVILALDEMKAGRGAELISISNLPVDKNLPTDECLQARVAHKSRVSEICILGINALLGGMLQEETSSHQGGFIHQVTPVKQWAKEASGRGAGGIPFHAENMFIQRPPSVLTLFCLQGEKGVETEYLYVSDIFRYLDDETIHLLKKPIYQVVTGDGFARKELNDTPVLDELGNGWKACRFYEENRIFSDKPEGKAAVARLHVAINFAKANHTRSVELVSGTLLAFSNAIRKNAYGGVLHGRRGQMAVDNVSASLNQKPRWLQRACIELAYM